MSSLLFFDIENFVKYTYENPKSIKEYQQSSMSKWRKYKNNPSISVKAGQQNLDYIDILDLIVCVNNAKDHNRNSDSNKDITITSTGKKVLNLLLLGNEIDNAEEDNKKILSCTAEKDADVFQSLRKLGKNNCVETFCYLPGRRVSEKQLQNLSRKYKNHIKDTGITKGLQDLVNAGMVEIVDDKFFKLSFEGCRKFLEKNM